MRAPKYWQEKCLTSKLLRPISKIYNYITQRRIRNTSGINSNIPVICIGNINIGGVGKTPTCIAIREGFKDKNVYFLSRGYKSKLKDILVDSTQSSIEVGDEALLLTKHSPTIISSDRIRGMELAQRYGAEVVIMDDGYQNPYLKKDYALLVLDGEYGLGNKEIFPSGPLRESLIDGLRRAHGVLIIGKDRQGLEEKIKSYSGIKIYKGRITPVLRGEDLKGKEVIAFAGIGRVEKFYNTLESLGAIIKKRYDFGDHHEYTEAELEEIIRYRDSHDYMVITTEKDYVRLAEKYKIKIKYLEIKLEIDKIEELIKDMATAIEKKKDKIR